MAKLLEGKSLALKIKKGLKQELDKLSVKPKLVAVQIGKNKSSELYLSNQKKDAALLGIEYEVISLDSSVSEAYVTDVVYKLNNNKDVTAIIIVVPLPKQIKAGIIISKIDPSKDAECMHPANLGRVLTGSSIIKPCTPMAVMELIKSTGISLYGKETVCVGHSDIVGKPLALMLLNEFATTTVCHIATSKRGRIRDHVRSAEILIVAVGKPGIIKGDWVKRGAIVVDVGINKYKGRIVGDVDFEKALTRASFITPVPGGVGPLTTAMLMRNIVYLFKRQRENAR